MADVTDSVNELIEEICERTLTCAPPKQQIIIGSQYGPISLNDSIDDLIDKINKLQDRVDALEITLAYKQIKDEEPNE